MNGSNRMLEKHEGLPPPYGKARFDTRRKYFNICMTIRPIGYSRKFMKNTDLFGLLSETKRIKDQFGDGCHTSISNIFVGQRSQTILCDGVNIFN